MNEIEKQLVKKLILQIKDLQQIKTKEEIGKYINNFINASILSNCSDEFITELLKIEQDFLCNK